MLRRFFARLLVLALTVASVPAEAVPTVFADYDGDGKATSSDLEILTDYVFGRTSRLVAPGDLNRDGVVDFADVQAFDASLRAQEVKESSGVGEVQEFAAQVPEGGVSIFASTFDTGGLADWTIPALGCTSLSAAFAPKQTAVTLFGTGFPTSGNVVRFNGVTAALLSEESTEITAVVPLAATDGPVTLTASGKYTVQCGNFQVNDAPVLAAIGGKTAPLGQTSFFTVSATDPDGDALTYSVEPRPLPVNASFDAADRLFKFRPGAGQHGVYQLTFTVSDGVNTDNETITLLVPAPGSSTTLGGIVYTTGGAPLAGVRIEVGTAAMVQAFSQADGTFLVTGIHEGGRQRVLIDGSTVPGHPAGTYATVPEQFELVEGANNLLGAPVYLLPLDLASADPVNPLATSMITSSPIVQSGNTFAPISMEVAPGSATKEGVPGNYSGSVYITAMPGPDLGPAPLPDDIDLTLYVAVQPFGVRYDPPAKVTFPNVEGFPVGSVIDIFGLDHATGRMLDIGDLRVDADNMMRSGTLNANGTFTYHGVIHENSWHGTVPQSPVEKSDSGSGNTGGGGGGDKGGPPKVPPSPCKVGSEVCPRTGDLAETHDIVPYFSQGVERGLRLIYHSQHANPNPVVSRLWTPGNFAPPPNFISTRLDVGGVDDGVDSFWSTAFCTPQACSFARFPRSQDVSELASGVYPAALTLTCRFTVSRRDATYRQKVSVINESDSPYGAGWSIRGLERVHRSVTGDLLLSDGTVEGSVFTPALRARAELSVAAERDFYRLVGSKGTAVSLQMKRRSSEPDGSSQLDPQIELRDSRGVLIATDNNSGRSLVEGPGEDAQLDAFVLPATDTYTVVARGASGTFGPYDLYLTTLIDTPLVVGQLNIPNEVAPSYEFTGDVSAGGEQDVHNFSASAGTRVTIELDRLASQQNGHGSLNPRLELRTSDNVLLIADNDTGDDDPPGPGRNALIPSYTLPATDSYKIVAAGEGGSTGPYRLTVTFGNLTGSLDPGDGTVEVEPVVISPAGDYSVLTLRSDDSLTRRMPNGTVKEYDVFGRMVSVTDRNGNATVYEYDPSGRLSTITDPVGKETLFSYDDGAPIGACDGRLASITDPAGRMTNFWHDSACNLVMIEDPDGAVREFGYTNAHVLSSQVSPRGFETPDPTDFKTTYETDYSGRFIRANLPGGGDRELTPDQRIGLVKAPSDCVAPGVDPGCQANPVLPKAEASIDTVYTDAMNRSTNYNQLDGEGNSPDAADPLNRHTTSEHDAVGNVVKRIEPSGHTMLYGYDDRGNLTSVTDQVLGGTRYFTYDDEFSVVTSVTDARGYTTTFDLDDAGNVEQITTPLGRTATFSYNSVGQVETSTDFSGLLTDYVYDADGDLVQILRGTGPSQRMTTFVPDAVGRAASATDPLLRATSWIYDDANRITSLSIPGSRTVGFGWDLNGNLVALTPPGKPAHVFSHDQRDTMTAYSPPTVSGDPTISYGYNLEQQLTGMTAPGPIGSSLTYDGSGATKTVVISHGTYTYNYNATSGLLTSINAPGGVNLATGYSGSLPISETWSGPVTGSVSWTYDKDGRLATQSVNGANTVAYTYDEDGLLIGVGAETITRDPQSGLPTQVALGSVTTVMDWNEFSELENEATDFNGSVLFEQATTRDKLGRIVQEIETTQGVTSTFEYRYNGAGRLDQVKKDLVVVEAYTFDLNGNRLSSSNSLGSSSGTFNSQDQQTSQGAATFTYSGGGALSTSAVPGTSISYSYDLLGNLRSAVVNGTTTFEYLIDGSNRRVGRKIGGALTQGFLFGGPLHPVAELDGSNALTSRFVFGTHGNAPEYMTKGGQVLRVLLDQRGSPRLVVNTATGAVVHRMDFDAWGIKLVDTAPSFQPFGYAGGVEDPSLGFVRFGARDYSPGLGRWLSKDPALFGGGDSNLYSYVFSLPTSLVDPSGLDVYLGNTPAVAGYHQRVVVDTPTGQYGQSYGMRNRTDPQQGFSEAWGEDPSPSAPGSGIVYEDPGPTTEVKRRFPTSSTEDAYVRDHLRDQLNRTGPYNAFSNSCRDYSQDEFDRIVEMVRRQREIERQRFPRYAL